MLTKLQKILKINKKINEFIKKIKKFVDFFKKITILYIEGLRNPLKVIYFSGGIL